MLYLVVKIDINMILFRLSHFDRITLSPNDFVPILNHQKYAQLDKNRNRINSNKILSTFAHVQSSEMLDFAMECFPDFSRTDYVSLYGGIKNGVLPNDLTPTERVLTNFIHGRIDRLMAVLLVSALENMAIEDVLTELENLKY